MILQQRSVLMRAIIWHFTHIFVSLTMTTHIIAYYGYEYI